MDRKIAAQIAETITNEQLSEMFNRAKSEIQDWMNNGAGVPNRCSLQFKNRKEVESYVNREEAVID
tara:strand:+ start:620 stop:817 length:198 start_codon:yes stop_codon:yes gene_type:complete